MLHCVVGCSFYFISKTFVPSVKTIIIDLTVMPGGLAGEVSGAKSDKVASRKSVDRRKPALNIQRTIARSEPRKFQEKVPDRMPEHTVESASPTVVPTRGPEGPTAAAGAASSGATGGGNGPAIAAKGDNIAAGGKGTGGPGKSAEQLKDGYLKEHFAYIKDIIQRNINYPQRARRMGWTGKVVVSFVINENGRASDERILQSSGFEVLDSNVIATIKAVSPFPRPPVKAELRVPIIYRLE
jgi:protein TonB